MEVLTLYSYRDFTRRHQSNQNSSIRHTNLSAHQATPPRKIIKNWKQKNSSLCSYRDYASLIRILSRKRMPRVAENLFLEIKSEGCTPDYSTMSSLILCYAENGLLPQARAVWDEMINSSFVPDIRFVSELINAYGEMGHFREVTRVLRELKSRREYLLPDIYALAISCFGKRGQLDMMESTLMEFVSMGFVVDSATGNAVVIYYSMFGSLAQMEFAYGRLKKFRILIEEEAIRAIAFAYIKEKKFYKISVFVRDVGLGRKNVGNLLWNLLLVSYAAKFKMKSLQREFMRMVEAGFRPDLTTFNIRSLAFSRMSLLWDLHVSLEHMKHEKIVPDLVTYGCVVDAYLDRKLGGNLPFALNKMNVEDYCVVETDPFVFEAMGKGDFHSSSEAMFEYTNPNKWIYKKLIAVYLRKKHRSNQIFWNY